MDDGADGKNPSVSYFLVGMDWEEADLVGQSG